MHLAVFCGKLFGYEPENAMTTVKATHQLCALVVNFCLELTRKLRRWASCWDQRASRNTPILGFESCPEMDILEGFRFYSLLTS